MSATAVSSSILLVDDDAEFLRALTKVLEKEGYEVVAQPDAQQAMAYIQTTGQRFDLVISDVYMPGTPGTRFLTSLKSAFPATPVILITAFGDWGQYMEALRDGAAEYLSKPVEKPELLAAVRRALHNGKRPSAPPVSPA